MFAQEEIVFSPQCVVVDLAPPLLFSFTGAGVKFPCNAMTGMIDNDDRVDVDHDNDDDEHQWK